MKCPYCGHPESKVIDSRPADENASIRRRRECLSCAKRFTTYETVESLPMVVIKKDGSLEAFHVQKVIDAVGKSAYRALTKFTEEEKKHICQYVIDKVDELEEDRIPIPIMHNIVESALEDVDRKSVV